MKSREFWKPVLIALGATPICLFLGIASGGAGHGDYLLAKLLFPYTMLASLAAGTISLPLLLIAIFQLPVYGVLLGTAAEKVKLIPLVVGLAILHVVVAILCFLLAGASYT